MKTYEIKYIYAGILTVLVISMVSFTIILRSFLNVNNPITQEEPMCRVINTQIRGSYCFNYVNGLVHIKTFSDTTIFVHPTRVKWNKVNQLLIELKTPLESK